MSKNHNGNVWWSESLAGKLSTGAMNISWLSQTTRHCCGPSRPSVWTLALVLLRCSLVVVLVPRVVSPPFSVNAFFVNHWSPTYPTACGVGQVSLGHSRKNLNIQVNWSSVFGRDRLGFRSLLHSSFAVSAHCHSEPVSCSVYRLKTGQRKTASICLGR